MKRDSMINAALAVLAVCALGTSALALWIEFAPAAPQTPPSVLSEKRVPNWREYATGGHRHGPVSSRVTLVEFADYQCPFCGQLQRTVELLESRYAGRIAVIYHHYPLRNIHPHAYAAALASECAADQKRFDAMHQLLFAQQDSIGIRPWERYAILAGVPDAGRFARCITLATDSARVEADIADGNRLGIRGTPTLLLDSLRFNGNPSRASLDSIVRLMLGGRALSDR